MILIVGIGIGHAGEQVLIGLARQQIAVVQRVLAKIGQQRVARGIGGNDKAARMHGLGIGRRGLGRCHRGHQRLGNQGIHAVCHRSLLGHGYCRGCPRLLCACRCSRCGACRPFQHGIGLAIDVACVGMASRPVVSAEFHLNIP